MAVSISGIVLAGGDNADYRSHIRRGCVLLLNGEHSGGDDLGFDMYWRSGRKVPPVIFPPGPSGYMHDGSDGVPWLQRVIVWGVCIALVVLVAPAAAVVAVGVIGTLMGIR